MTQGFIQSEHHPLILRTSPDTPPKNRVETIRLEFRVYRVYQCGRYRCFYTHWCVDVIVGLVLIIFITCLIIVWFHYVNYVHNYMQYNILQGFCVLLPISFFDISIEVGSVPPPNILLCSALDIQSGGWILHCIQYCL